MPYTVQPGDNAVTIAQRSGLTLDQLKQLNPNGPASGDWNMVVPGETFNTSSTPVPIPNWLMTKSSVTAGANAAPANSIQDNGLGYAPMAPRANATADANAAGSPRAIPTATPYTQPGTLTPIGEPNYGTAPMMPGGGTANLPMPQSGIGAGVGDQLLDAQKSVLAAQQNQLGANLALFGPRAALTEADRALLSAREADVNATKAYLAEQTRANAERIAEQLRIQQAEEDVGDKVAVSKAQRTRDSLNYRFDIAGLPTPIEIVLPPGFSGNLPPGVVQKLQTLAEILIDKASDDEKMRTFRIEAARIHSANTGLMVSEAEIARGRVALTLEEAEEAARLAGLMVDQAQLNLSLTQLPPEPGFVYDEVTDSWVEPAQASLNQAIRQDQLRNQALGPLSAVPVSTLMEMATIEPPVINDQQLRNALIAQGLHPDAAESYVRLAGSRRASRNAGDDSGYAAAIAAINEALANSDF